jgi:hypothetical protein
MIKYRNKGFAENKWWKYVLRDIQTRREVLTGKPCEIGSVDGR